MQGRWPCDNGDRDRRYAAMKQKKSQGVLSISRSWEETRKNSTLGSSEGAQPQIYFEWKLLAFRSMREYIFIFIKSLSLWTFVMETGHSNPQPHLRNTVLGSLTPEQIRSSWFWHLLPSDREFPLLYLTVILKRVEFLHNNERKHTGF